MTAPTTATVGELITATKYNQIPARLTAFTSYTPTIANWTSATIAPTTTGRYWLAGNICHVLVQSKLGTGAITVGNVTVSLPVAVDTTGMILDSTLLPGTSGYGDVSLGDRYAGFVRILDANTVRALRLTTAGSGALGALTSALPFTWATLDELSLMFSYPVA